MSVMTRDVSTIARISRENAGYTREELAEVVESSPRTIARYELRELPLTPRVCANWARATGSKNLLKCYCANCPVKSAAAEM